MGWKTSAIFFDGHHPGGEQALCEALGFAGARPVAQTTVEHCFYPQALHVGRYGHATLLFEPELPIQILAGDRELSAPLLAARLFPRILVAGLHSVTNFYGYAWYQDGELRRRVMGAGEDGSHDEHGARTAFEQRVFARYRREERADGAAVYVDEHDAHTIDALGEEMVFEGMAELLGHRPDAPDGAALFATPIARYALPRASVVGQVLRMLRRFGR